MAKKVRKTKNMKTSTMVIGAGVLLVLADVFRNKLLGSFGDNDLDNNKMLLAGLGAVTVGVYLSKKGK